MHFHAWKQADLSSCFSSHQTQTSLFFFFFFLHNSPYLTGAIVQLLWLYLQIRKCCVIESAFFAHLVTQKRVTHFNKDVYNLSSSVLDMIFNSYDVEKKPTYICQHKKDGQTKSVTIHLVVSNLLWVLLPIIHCQWIVTGCRGGVCWKEKSGNFSPNMILTTWQRQTGRDNDKHRRRRADRTTRWWRKYSDT